MLLRIVSIIFPIFLVVLIGVVVGRRLRPDMSSANRLNLEVFLPALIFSALSAKSFNLADNVAIMIGAVVVIAASGILTWPLARAFGYEPKTLLPPIMFNNVGNMGVPLMLFTFGEQVLGAAIVLLMVVTVIQFTFTPWLLGGHASPSRILRDPFVAASLAGIGVSLSGVTVWQPVMAGVKILGDISLGLMIFSLGVRLSRTRPGAWRISVFGAVLRPLLGMLLAWAFGAIAGLSRAEQDILFLFGAFPPAVGTYIFAERYNQEPDKVASIVMLGNAAALVFIPLALALRL
jgi:malate permease and related proteins